MQSTLDQHAWNVLSQIDKQANLHVSVQIFCALCFVQSALPLRARRESRESSKRQSLNSYYPVSLTIMSVVCDVAPLGSNTTSFGGRGSEHADRPKFSTSTHIAQVRSLIDLHEHEQNF
jgi:hypothetical protein